MTKHAKINASGADLSRRSFLVTAGASGLVFGFGALPGATTGPRPLKPPLPSIRPSGTRSARTAS